MTETTITQLPDPSGFSADPLTGILRSGARRLIEQAVEAELAVLLAAHAGERTADGRARLVRHGHLPEREVMTGIGPVPVKVPRVRDRSDVGEKVRFTSYQRRMSLTHSPGAAPHPASPPDHQSCLTGGTIGGRVGGGSGPFSRALDIS